MKIGIVVAADTDGQTKDDRLQEGRYRTRRLRAEGPIVAAPPPEMPGPPGRSRRPGILAGLRGPVARGSARWAVANEDAVEFCVSDNSKDVAAVRELAQRFERAIRFWREQRR